MSLTFRRQVAEYLCPVNSPSPAKGNEVVLETLDTVGGVIEESAAELRQAQMEYQADCVLAAEICVATALSKLEAACVELRKLLAK